MSPVVAVAALTRRRPQGLATLLKSLRKLKVGNFQPIYIVIDNDEIPLARPTFDRHTKKLRNAHYFWEPRRGIPIARNRAMDEAIRLGANVLCFIDDDEYPDANWIVRLVETHEQTKCHLIGGPVRIAPPAADLNLWQKIVHASVTAWTADREKRSASAAGRGEIVTVITNNWLGDLSWITEKKLRFDEEWRFTGGTDSLFFRMAKRSGARSAWCRDAIVYETATPERLSLRYHFHRARAQTTNHFLQKSQIGEQRGKWRTIGDALARLFVGVGSVFIPTKGRASLVSGVRSVGRALGYIDALRGRRIDLYE